MPNKVKLIVLSLFLVFTAVTILSSCSKPESAKTNETKTSSNETKPGVDTSILDNYGCVKCHSLDGTDGRGPTFVGLYGKTVTVMENGEEKEVTANEDYIKTSVLDPDKQLVKGYKPSMSSYEDELIEGDLDKIVEVLKKLK